MLGGLFTNRAALWEGELKFKMAARSVLRAVSLCRRNVALSSSSARALSIFTKYREPPNGFLFNEKVTYFISSYFVTKFLFRP